MEFITDSMTLTEFETAKDLYIVDPATGVICKVFLKSTIDGRRRFMHGVLHGSNTPSKYLRFPSGYNGVVVDTTKKLLTIIKGGDFTFMH